MECSVAKLLPLRVGVRKAQQWRAAVRPGGQIEDVERLWESESEGDGDE